MKVRGQSTLIKGKRKGIYKVKIKNNKSGETPK